MKRPWVRFIVLWVLGGLVVLVVVVAGLPEYWFVAAPALLGISYLVVSSRMRPRPPRRRAPPQESGVIVAEEYVTSSRFMEAVEALARGREVEIRIAPSPESAPEAWSPEQEAELAEMMKTLTPRERKIIELFVEGRTHEEIARELGISRTAVQAHRSRIMRKLRSPLGPEHR